MFCSKCGKEITGAGAFCRYCGAPINSVVAPTPEVTPAPAATPAPEVAPTPAATPAPEVAPTPAAAPAPEVAPTPVAAPAPEATPAPVVAPAPVTAPTPVQPVETQPESKKKAKKEKKAGKKKAPAIVASIIAVLALAGAGIFGYNKFVGDSDISTERSGVIDDDSEKGTKPAANLPDDDWTIMIYMVGANLESEAGLMSKSIKSIKEATYGDNINVIVQTGGATQWFDEDIDADRIQRWSIEKGEMKLVEEFDIDHYVTVDGLSDFMISTVEAFPAKRYGVVFKDHGGGTLLGFGQDEYFPEDGLSIADLHEAFDITNNETGVNFDFIGFDACLMATIDIAYAVKDYADYMIASEESEVSWGDYTTDGYNTWAYGDILTGLNEDPDMPMDDSSNHEGLGRLICSTYFDSYDYDDVENAVAMGEVWKTTLTLIDLSKVDAAYNALCEFFAEANDYITTSEESWNKLLKARLDCQGFGDDDFEQIDIIDFLNNSELGFEQMHDWQDAIRDVVAYNRNDAKNANGLAMYFPLYYCDEYNGVKKNLEAIGYDADYFDLFTPFVAKVQGLMSSNNNSGENGDPTAENDAGNNANSALWNGTIEFYEDSDGSLYIPVSSEQASAIDVVMSQYVLSLSDGGYTFVGEMPNYYAYDSDYGLFASDAMSIICIDGNYVDITFRDKGTYSDTGEEYYYNEARAYVNGEEANIVILTDWTDDEYTVSVRGYYLEGDDSTRYDFEQGDEIQFIYTEFDENMEVYDEFVNENIVVAGKDGYVEAYISDEYRNGYFRYRMTDIYGNNYYSEWVQLYE